MSEAKEVKKNETSPLSDQIKNFLRTMLDFDFTIPWTPELEADPGINTSKIPGEDFFRAGLFLATTPCTTHVLLLDQDSKIQKIIIANSMKEVLRIMNLLYKQYAKDKKDRTAEWEQFGKILTEIIQDSYDENSVQQYLIAQWLSEAYSHRNMSSSTMREVISQRWATIETKLFINLDGVSTTDREIVLKRSRAVYKILLLEAEGIYNRTIYRRIELPSGRLFLGIAAATAATYFMTPIPPENVGAATAAVGTLGFVSMVAQMVSRSYSRVFLGKEQSSYFCKLGKKYRDKVGKKDAIVQYLSDDLLGLGIYAVVQEIFRSECFIKGMKAALRSSRRAENIYRYDFPLAQEMLANLRAPSPAPLPLPPSRAVPPTAPTSSSSSTQGNIKFLDRRRYEAKLIPDEIPPELMSEFEVLQTALQKKYPKTHQYLKIVSYQGRWLIYDYQDEAFQKSMQAYAVSDKKRIETFINRPTGDFDSTPEVLPNGQRICLKEEY